MIFDLVMRVDCSLEAATEILSTIFSKLCDTVGQ